MPCLAKARAVYLPMPRMGHAMSDVSAEYHIFPVKLGGSVCT